MPLSVTMFPGPSVCLSSSHAQNKFMDGRSGLWAIFFRSQYSSSPDEAPCFWQVHLPLFLPRSPHSCCAAASSSFWYSEAPFPQHLSFHFPCSHWHSLFPWFLCAVPVYFSPSSPSFACSVIAILLAPRTALTPGKAGAEDQNHSPPCHRFMLCNVGISQSSTGKVSRCRLKTPSPLHIFIQVYFLPLFLQ